MIMWAKDVTRSVDYLHGRPDIAKDKVGYIGLSWGGIVAPVVLAAVDGSKPAIYRRFKSRISGGDRDREFYFVASSVRKSVCTLVRQLRGPHFRTCA